VFCFMTMDLVGQIQSRTGLLSSLLFGVAIPLTSLAMLIVGCGDNRRQVNNKKKRSKPGAPLKEKHSSRKHKSSKKILDPSKKIIDPSKKKSVPHKRSVRAGSVKDGSSKRTVHVNKTGSNPKLPNKTNVLSRSVSKKSTPSVKPKPLEGTGLQKQLPSVKTPQQQTFSIENTPKKQPQQERRIPTSSDRSGSMEKSEKLSSAAKKNELNTKNALPIFCSEASNISVEPHQLHYNVEGGKQQVTVHNQSKDGSRLAVKIKCSDNHLYHVNPVFAFLEPKSCASFAVYRNAGLAKADKMVLLTAKVSKEETNPKNAFKDENMKPSLTVVPLLAIDESIAAKISAKARSAVAAVGAI